MKKLNELYNCEYDIEIKGIKLCFTTDLRQNDTSLSKRLVEFKMDEETKKYKVETLELKILE